MPLSTLSTGTERVVVLALDEALRATIHQTLEVLGYRVEVAADAEELLAAVAAEPTDLLMIDGLGRGDADILRRAARAAAAACASSRRSIPAARPSAFEGSSTASLTKPFTLADLAGTVRRTLDARGRRGAVALLVEQHASAARAPR